MGFKDLVETLGKQGMPLVAAAVIIYWFNRLMTKKLGDGNGIPGTVVVALGARLDAGAQDRERIHQSIDEQWVALDAIRDDTRHNCQLAVAAAEQAARAVTEAHAQVEAVRADLAEHRAAAGQAIQSMSDIAMAALETNHEAIRAEVMEALTEHQRQCAEHGTPTGTGG